MNETITQEVITAILETMIEMDPAVAAPLKGRLEVARARANASGWRHEAEIVQNLIDRL